MNEKEEKSDVEHVTLERRKYNYFFLTIYILTRFNKETAVAIFIQHNILPLKVMTW